MKHVIIIGGVSVDPDDNEHDKNPYNFINPGVVRAKKYRSKAIVLFHAKSYELRAKKYPPDKEHSWVAKTLKERQKIQKEKKYDHFYQTVSGKAKQAGFTLKKIKSAKDLTSQLNNINQIATIHYFGHSNDTELFIEYNTDGSGNGIEIWGKSEGKRVPDWRFNEAANKGVAFFASYGCYQGKNSGLCRQLQAAWLIKTLGARGKTNYEAIGKLKPFPTGNYVEYPVPQSKASGFNYGSPKPVSYSNLY